jgi:hypothetical protein
VQRRHYADNAISGDGRSKDTNQPLNDAIEFHLMAKPVRPAPSDPGKRLGDTKRRKSDEVKERKFHHGPGAADLFVDLHHSWMTTIAGVPAECSGSAR